MRIALGTLETVNVSKFEELARVIDVDDSVSLLLQELIFGRSNESDEERAARLDAARDILTELRAEAPELAKHAVRLLAGQEQEAHAAAAYAAHLRRVVVIPRSVVSVEVAA